MRLDPAALHAACTRACASLVPPPPDELLRDILFEDLAEGDAAQLDPGQLRARVLDVCTSLGACDGEELAEALHPLLAAALQAQQAAVNESQDDLPPGCCHLCERQMPLTRHHLLPRSQHAVLRQRGLTLAQLSVTLPVCRQCHNTLHSLIDEATLAAEFCSAEALLTHPGVAAFVAWASKQRGRADGIHTLAVRR